ncbi:Cilia- and flagella-associated protein 57 [Hondaea fermentalgiana]|uniref:Cilia-and flagella-associated protein 57 n=1 Tax=Hondaea fermentalgiana TaxID=2315210 RepID=A0A2R5GD82_9STRA|nr:Cilia- and flagella-associated protein 57 [Hondaea fermentalgiana]|eukprot:GBG27688.1 Cilia- and flagella-associated protein 57 [Hondaea fermentalgiana]
MTRSEDGDEADVLTHDGLLGKEDSTESTVAASKIGGGGGADSHDAHKHCKPEDVRTSISMEASIGISGSIRDTVCYLNEREIAFPVGKRVAYANTETREMSFLSLRAKVTAMCVSPDRLALAVAYANDEAGAACVIAIFHVATQKLLRELRPTACIGEVVSMCFSGDSKFLFTSIGAPRHEVFYWKWDAEKLIARSKCPTHATRVRFHPTDNSVVSVSGPGFFRLWKLGSNCQLKLQPTMQPKFEAEQVLVDHAWFDENTLITLHERGECTVFAADASAATQTRCMKLVAVQNIRLETRDEADYLRAEVIAIHERGFVVGGNNGMLCAFEETTEGQEEPFMCLKTFQTAHKEILASIAISPLADTLVCCTRCNSLLQFPLGNVDIILENEDPFKPFPFVQHRGPVTVMDVCLGPRPLLATAGPDKMLRIVNFETLECEIEHHLTPGFGDPVSVALHPNGSLLAIGFKEHVRMYDLILGKLREKGCIYLKTCTFVCFSHGGQYLICSTNLSINVYGTYSASLLHTFSEHLGNVQDAIFNSSDTVLASVAIDGTVMTRRVVNGARVDGLSASFETCQLLSIATDADAERAVVAGSDGSLREIVGGAETMQVFASDPEKGLPPEQAAQNADGQLGLSHPGEDVSWKRRMSTTEEVITSLLLSVDETALFAGTSTGDIRVYRYPLSVYRGEYERLASHGDAVTRLRRSFDGRFLFSSARDGTCFIQRLHLSFPGASEDEIKLLNLRQGMRNEVSLWRNDADSVLVSHREWIDNVKAVEDAKKEVQSAIAAHEYAMHLKDNEWMETVRNARSESAKAVTKERARYDELQQRHEQFVQKHMEEKQRLEASRVGTAQTIENEYEKRLGDALRRVDERTEAIENLRQRTDEILVAQETKHVEEIEVLKRSLGDQIQQLRKEVDQLERELTMERERHAETVSQQQHEYDLELLHLKGAVETAVQKERSNLAIKQGQLVEQQNKFQRLRNKVSTMKQSKADDEARIKSLEAQVASLQSTLRRYEANLEQREVAFREKEKTILHLRSNQKTLDNFRYVLDHRIEKLTEEKGPVKQHIAKLESHIRAMYSELVSEFERKKVTERQMSTKQMKVDALSNEVNKLRASLRDRDREVASLSHTITTCAQTSDTKHAIAILAEAYQRQVLKQPFWSVRKSAKTASTPMLPSVAAAGSGVGSGSASGGAGGSGLGAGIAPPAGGTEGSVGGGLGHPPSGGVDQEHSLGIDTSAGPAGGNNGDALASPTDRSSVEEIERQRDQMFKTVETLQKALRISERKGHTKSKTHVQENAFLITECNRLRKEAVANKMRADQLETKVAELESRMGSNQAEDQLANFPFGGAKRQSVARSKYAAPTAAPTTATATTPTKQAHDAMGAAPYGDDDVRQEDVSRPATRQGVPGRSKRIPSLPQRPGSK